MGGHSPIFICPLISSMAPLNWKGRPYRPIGGTGFIKVYKPDINELMKPLALKKGLGSAILTGNAVNPQNNVPQVTPTPSVTPTNTVTPSLTPTQTVTPTVTETPTNTPSVTPSETPTMTPSETPTNTPTISETPTQTPSQTASPTVTPSPTESPLPIDCLWNTTDEFWSGNTNQWQQCQDVPVSPTPSVTPTNTPTPSLTPTQTSTVTPTPSITPSATPAPFEPNQISNLQFWFMGNSGATSSSWTNYGLLGGSVTQGTLGNQPVVKTNTVFGTWTGTSMNFLSTDFMTGTFTNTNYSSSTIYCVYRQPTIANAGDPIAWRLWNTTTVAYQHQSRTSSPANGIAWAYLFQGTAITGSTYVNIPILSKIIASGTTSATSFGNLFLNENLIANGYTGATAPISATTVQFGSNTFNTFINTEIAELVVYNKNLSSSEQTQVENYLKTKYQYSSW